MNQRNEALVPPRPECAHRRHAHVSRSMLRPFVADWPRARLKPSVGRDHRAVVADATVDDGVSMCHPRCNASRSSVEVAS